MDNSALLPEEIGLIRWYRNLDQRTQNAINVWLLTGDTTLIKTVFTRRYQAAA